jgi:hypothetical protein
LWKIVFFLIGVDPLPRMSVTAIIFKRDLRRIESEFSCHTGEHHIMRNAGCSSVSETLMVALVCKGKLLAPADIVYLRGFRSFVNPGIPHSNGVPMIGRNRSILLGAHLAGTGAGFIAVTIKLTFVVKQFHGPAGNSSCQYDGQPDESGGIGKPRDASKPGTLAWKCESCFRPGSKSRLGFISAGRHRAEIVRHGERIIHFVAIELNSGDRVGAEIGLLVELGLSNSGLLSLNTEAKYRLPFPRYARRRPDPLMV